MKGKRVSRCSLYSCRALLRLAVFGVRLSRTLIENGAVGNIMRVMVRPVSYDSDADQT